MDLEPTIQSLLGTKALAHLTIVDNGGCEWAQRIEDPRARYIKAPCNGGYGYGHNIAIKKFAHTTDFHLICNPDINFVPNELDSLVAYASNRPEGLFMPNIIYPDGKRQELCKLLPRPRDLFARRFLPRLAERLDENYLLRFADYSKPFSAPSLSGCFMLFRSDALIRVGGFDERYFMYLEDIDLSRRVAKSDGCLYVPQVTVVHEFQKESYRNPILLKAHIISAIRYFNKWGWIFDKERRELNRKCLSALPRSR